MALFLTGWRQSQGKAKAKEINAYSYVECSSKAKKNLADVFQDLPKAKQPSGFINKLISW
jgi:hypothetical protein